MYEFTHTDIQTDRRTDMSRDIVASDMKQIATKKGCTINKRTEKSMYTVSHAAQAINQCYKL